MRQHYEGKDKRKAGKCGDTEHAGEHAFRHAGDRGGEHGEHVGGREAGQCRADRTLQKELRAGRTGEGCRLRARRRRRPGDLGHGVTFPAVQTWP